MSRTTPLPRYRPADGGQRSRAAVDYRGEGRDQDNDRAGDSDTGQGLGPDAVDVPDVDTVHEIVEQVDQLGHHCRDGHAENQRGHGRSTQTLFIL